MRKRILKITAVVLAVIVVAVVGVGFWLHSQLAGSLAQLDGEHRAAGIAADVTVQRDSLGIPTIRAASR
jgi:penicillin amidase